MITTDKIASMACTMYQASKKHSSFPADLVKLEEEFDEFKDAVCFNQGDSAEEFADLLHMMFRLFFYDLKPMSENHATELFSSVLEHFESKFKRQMIDRGWNK